MTWIKTCGTTNLEDARAAVGAGVDALGFVFAASPRQITTEQAERIIASMPAAVEKVGVFVNDSVVRISEIVQHVGLTAVQLHGTESLEFVHELHAKLSNGHGARIIRAMKPPAAPVEASGSAALPSGILERDPETHEISAGPLAAVLVDSASGLQRGGTGKTFDWQASRLFIPMMNAYVKVIIAGGLTPANVGEAIATLRPWGVDVCSGVEHRPGKKDYEKMRAFVAAVRQADRL